MIVLWRTSRWLSFIYTKYVQTGRDGDWTEGRFGGAGGAIRIRWICFSSFWCISSMKSCSFFTPSFATAACGAFPLVITLLLLLLSSFVSSSSSDASELRSEFDGDGDWGERFSCSWIIVRNSWMDSLRAQSCERSERSSWRRPNCKEYKKLLTLKIMKV